MTLVPRLNSPAWLTHATSSVTASTRTSSVRLTSAVRYLSRATAIQALVCGRAGALRALINTNQWCLLMAKAAGMVRRGQRRFCFRAVWRIKLYPCLNRISASMKWNSRHLVCVSRQTWAMMKLLIRNYKFGRKWLGLVVEIETRALLYLSF